MLPPRRDVAQLTSSEPSETAPCKFCRCEIKLYLVDHEECELCRTCLVLGHEFLKRDFEDVLTSYDNPDRLAWKIGEYIWMHADRKYQDHVDQREKLVCELRLLEQHRKLVSLLDEAKQIQEDAGDPKPNAKNRVYENIFEDMARILGEEYPDGDPPDEGSSSPD